MSPPSEVEEDLAAVSRYCQDAPWFRVFFTGANPFVLTTDKLKTLAQMVKKYCPNYSSIGCFGRITNVTNKTVDELKELRALGYNGLTFGVETGDDEALAGVRSVQSPARSFSSSFTCKSLNPLC